MNAANSPLRNAVFRYVLRYFLFYGKWGGLIALDLAYCEVTAGFLMSRWMRWSNLNRWVSAMF